MASQLSTLFRHAVSHTKPRIAQTLLSKHTTRGLAVAGVDRYGAIRDFFTRPIICAPARSNIVFSIKKEHDTYLATSRLNLQIRQFHASTVRWSPPSKHNHDTKKPPDEKTSSASSQSSSADKNQDEIGKSAAYSQHTGHPQQSEQPQPAHLADYSHFFRRLAQSLPHMNRPTRDDLLDVTEGFWQRLKVRFKWFTIRSFRKFNADDMSAFLSLLLLSQTVWVLVGTTTFFSVIFATANSLQLQEKLARTLSDYLTAETGVTVVFESAIVPKWKDSRISFKNVFISRRPRLHTTDSASKSARSAHLAALGYDVSNHPVSHGIPDEEHDDHQAKVDDDENYAMFDLNVDSIDVTLSLWRWLDGKGIVQDAVIKGVRGVLDRSVIYYDPEVPLDPASFRRAPSQGDFDLESFSVEDVLITIHQPGDFRPFTFSIFRADLHALRRRWLLFDFLNAESIVGQLDGCLFSLHRPQAMGRTNERDLRDSPWARISRFRIDGVNIDHLQAQVTSGGPITWLTAGKIDAVLDFKFARDASEQDALDALLGGLADALALTELIPGQRVLAKPPLTLPEDTDEGEERRAAEMHKVVVDIDLRFKDLKAAVPVFTNDLSYVSNALIRPIVAFMNANHTLVPLRCRAVKDLSDFDGSWTLWETGLLDEIAIKTYEAMAYHVMQANFNHRIKTVSWWSLQKTVGAVLVTLRTLADPVRQHLKEVYTSLDEVGKAWAMEGFIQ